MSRRNLLILLLAVIISYACYLRGEQNPFARFAAEGLDTIREGSLDAIPSRELFDGAMRGMVGVLHKHGDEHSQYLDEAAANPLRSEIHQQFGGIGVRIGFLGQQHRLNSLADLVECYRERRHHDHGILASDSLRRPLDVALGSPQTHDHLQVRKPAVQTLA